MSGVATRGSDTSGMRGVRRERAMRAALAVVLLFGAATARTRAAEGEPVLSGGGLLARLIDPVAALTPLPDGVRVVQRSSHDRQGGNVDGGSWEPAMASQQPPTYVRRDPGGWVLLDERRPGCLTRMWFTASGGDAAAWGRIQMFFNGETGPRVDVPAADLFSGKIEAFPRPLVGDRTESSGGNYSYIPFCFAESLELRVTQVPPLGFFGWYQLTALVAPVGTPVETFAPASFDAGWAAEAIGRAGEPPLRDPDASVERGLAVGETARLLERSGAGSIRFLRLHVAPFDIGTLQSLRLLVRVDGSQDPQIEVPLGDLFGDGLEVRPIRSTAFGMSPDEGSGYFALPVPFSGGFTLDVSADAPASIRLEAWLGPALPGAGTLYGEHRAETSALGTDFAVLEADGSGRLAAWVLDVDGGPLSSPQYFLEGDERVHVDGSRSPEIHGTGTEDAFNGGFYYSGGAFSLPTHGAGPNVVRPSWGAARSQYRVFGADGVLWSSGVRFGMEHGGGDERSGELVANTTFSYRRAARIAPSDHVVLGDASSESAHGLTGSFERRSLAAYFEGDHDGNLPVSWVWSGGSPYRAPPADLSPEGVAADGIAFETPVSVTLAIDPANRGVALRRLLDAGEPSGSALRIYVDGVEVGLWWMPDTNPAKRWLEDDFEIPAAFSEGKSALLVTLVPAGAAPETAFGLEAWSRV